MGIELIERAFYHPKKLGSSHYFLYCLIIINCFFFLTFFKEFVFKFQRFVHTKHHAFFFIENFREECARHTRRHAHAT